MNQVENPGMIITEGKTKVIFQSPEDQNLVIIRNKDNITKNDDPSQTKVMTGKAELATATASAVFRLLKDAGIPVAFVKQLNQTDFLAPAVSMIPLEIIWRRCAVGSFLKRHPELKDTPNGLPHRFHQAVFELFLKTTGNIIRNRDGQEIGRVPVEDPFIARPLDDDWNLFHPKKPSWDSEADLNISVASRDILPESITVSDIENLLRRVGLVLEGAWSQLGCRLVDFKIEMGITSDGRLVVADVIDADSWRLRDANWNELSKQLFRDDKGLDEIADKYALVAFLVQQLRIPKQAIVLWRGSDQDKLPDFESLPGIDVLDVVISGHKSPEQSLKKLEEILTLYPEGGVILACVGMSNGLGPILSARTSWPVIGVPMSAKDFKEDVWSSLRMPSQVPMATILNPKNAWLMALDILAQKNPAAYALRQLAIEQLDC